MMPTFQRLKKQTMVVCREGDWDSSHVTLMSLNAFPLLKLMFPLYGKFMKMPSGVKIKQSIPVKGGVKIKQR
jgi:hypothetical protein